MQITKDIFMNSSDTTLKNEVLRRMDLLPDYAKNYGPVYYHIADSIYYSCDEKEIRALQQRLSLLKLNHFDNENLSLYQHQITLACQFLAQYPHGVPSDIHLTIYDALEECSVEDFVLDLKIKKANNDPILQDWCLLLDYAVKSMHEIMRKNRWDVPKKNNKTSSAYNAQAHQSTTDDKTRFYVDTTPPKSGKPKTRKRPDGRTETWCERERCCIDRKDAQGQPLSCNRKGRWVTHDDTDEAHKGFWEQRETLKKKKGETKSTNDNNTTNQAPPVPGATVPPRRGAGNMFQASYPTNVARTWWMGF